MKRSWITVSDVFSIIYFIFIMLPFLFLLFMADIMSIIQFFTVIESGFSNISNAIILWVCMMAISLSFLIPVFRRLYYRIPVLEPFILIFTIDSLILVLAYEIFNLGYAEVSPGRHILFAILTLAWLVGGRFVQCLYLKRYPIRFAGKEMLS